MTQDNCTHTRSLPGRWVDNPYYDAKEAALGGFSGDAKEWEPGGEEPTTRDIDLHRYECTQCGKIFYYSDRARQFFEEGTTFNIKGLDGKS